MITKNEKFDWEDSYQKFIRKIKKNGDNFIYYIINEKNTKITANVIEQIIHEYTSYPEFKVKYLLNYYIAMTHPSYTYMDKLDLKGYKSIMMNVNLQGGQELKPITKDQLDMAIKLSDKSKSYQRLEYLGDSIIRQVLSNYLLIRFPENAEGPLTKLRAQLENQDTLAELSKKLKLNNYMLISRNYEVTNARNKNTKMISDVFESFIAALYYDFNDINYDNIGKDCNYTKLLQGKGYDICNELIINLIEENIDIGYLLSTDRNFKDELLQEFHKRNWGDPKYNLWREITENNNNNIPKKMFEMIVRTPENEIIGKGIGSSKQKGEKLAAKVALEWCNDNKDEEDSIIVSKSLCNLNNRYSILSFNDDSSVTSNEESVCEENNYEEL